jgi:hypothetical protein
VLFSIQTCIADRATLTPEEEAAFVAWKAAQAAAHGSIA